MDNRTKGSLISGFGAKLIVAGVALWVGYEAFCAITSLFGQINTALGGL